MKNKTFWILFVISLMFGAIITWIDTCPNWDDAGITAGMILISTLLLGFLFPKHAWLWALAVGVWIPLIGILLAHNSGTIIALIIAIIGAFAGALGRKLVSILKGAAI